MGFRMKIGRRGSLRFRRKWNEYVLRREVEQGEELVLYNTIHVYSVCSYQQNKAMYTKLT